METVVRFVGVPEFVLDKLVSMGYFATKTEALRAGVLELGKEYKILGEAGKMEEELVARKLEREEKELKRSGGKYLSEKEALSKYR
ncbi:MAG: hypothetical protein V1787_00675 [Candidatus Micrarchaeota archaeon]